MQIQNCALPYKGFIFYIQLEFIKDTVDNESIRNIVMLELVAPEDPTNRIIPEDEGRELHERYKKMPKDNVLDLDIEYLFEPIKDKDTRQKFIDLFKALV